MEFELDEKLEYVVDMVETYGYALVNSGHADAALGFEGLGQADTAIDFYNKAVDYPPAKARLKLMLGIENEE